MFVLSTLLQESTGLEAALKSYDRWKMLGYLGGLITCPKCHANTLRLEALVHLAVAICRDTHPVARDDLVNLFETHFHEIDLTLQEDPLEDVFISNVFEGSGNHRIFEGIWERNDYWLQSLLRACQGLPEKPEYARMLRSVGALLDLSEAVAERNGLPRNSAGDGEPKGVIHVPEAAALAAYGRNIEFQVGELQALGIDPDALGPFIWRDKAPEKLLEATFENTPLERRPVLRRGDSFLLVLPTAVSIACRRFILETVNKAGDLKVLDSEVSHAQGRSAQKALDRLKGEPWKPGKFFRLPTRGFVSLFMIPFQFDTDKFGLLTIVQPPLQTALKDGFSNFQDYISQGSQLGDDLKIIADQLASEPGFRQGLFVMVIGGVGMPVAIPAPQFSAKWEFISYSIPNFEMLAWVKDADIPMIWRLASQQSRAIKKGVRILNPNGDFNLFASWQKSGYSLIPLDAPTDRPNLLFAPPINALLELRTESRKAVDVHVAPRKEPECYVEVERKNAYAWFKVTREAPYYVQVRRGGELAAVVESRGAWWWMVVERKPKTARESSAIFQIWDCFGHWLVPVAAELSRLYSPGNAVLEFRISFPDIGDWKEEVGSQPVGDATPSWALIRPDVVEIVVKEEFFRTCMQPENRAERAMVTLLLEAGAKMLAKNITLEDQKRLTDQLIPLGVGRHFHVIPGHDATLLAYHGPADSYGLREEVVAEVSQQLGAAIAPERRGEQTEDPEQVRSLVRAAVANLKEQIATRLRQYGLRETVLRCMEILDHTHRDYHRWKVSAAALLALHKDHEEIMREARDRENDRAGASTAARGLIETALFSCGAESGERPSDAALQELLGLTQTLIALANYDLPKRAGFPAGWVRIAPNGTLQVRNKFLDDLRVAYVQSHFDSGYKATAGQYKELFERDSNKPLPTDLSVLGQALKAEIGLDVFEAVDVGTQLNHWGMQQRKSVLLIRRSELRDFLAKALSIAPQDIEPALQSLRIYPRGGWDKELPVECDYRDVLPWRFKRRFSLLRRPLIEITREADPLMVVSPVLVRDALSYLVENTYRGEFPPQFFASRVAHQYYEVAIKRRSRAFVQKTAEVMQRAGFETKVELAMEKLGAPRKLGDIDVLAWRKSPKLEVWALECKALRKAQSAEEILDQLDDFRGDADDRRDRHQQRLQWLRANPDALARFIGFSGAQLDGRILTSHQVPMQFLPEADAQKLFVDIERWEAALV